MKVEESYLHRGYPAEKEQVRTLNFIKVHYMQLRKQQNPLFYKKQCIFIQLKIYLQEKDKEEKKGNNLVFNFKLYLITLSVISSSQTDCKFLVNVMNLVEYIFSVFPTSIVSKCLRNN